MKNYHTIIQPVTTEKSSLAQSRGQYTFLVSKAATKVDVKNAVKEIFGAEVKSVKIMITPKKERLIGRGRIWTKRPVAKKAIVTLKEGKTIDPNKIAKAGAAKQAKPKTTTTKKTKK